MFEISSISEKLLFSTVKICTSAGSGTGFFFTFSFFGEDKRVPVIITNKHVLNNNTNEETTFLLHTNKNDLRENQSIAYNSDWYFNEDYDLAFTFANPIFEQIKTQLKKEIFYTTITEDLIPDINQLEELSAIEDIVMVGYPIGLSDEVNNLPILRKGITASHPAIDFNGKKEAVADIACFFGSSGSPIFILNESIYGNKKGNINIGQRIIFLGVNYAGHIHNSEGKIIAREAPTRQELVSQTSQFINTSIYVKSSEILNFKNFIKSKIGL